MKKYNTYYYLLFVLLVMGAFASMAQNSYGLKIMGMVSFTFCFLFLTQLIYVIKKIGRKDFLGIAELSGLSILSFILGLRVYFIHFEFVEILFLFAGIVLIFVFGFKMIESYNRLKSESQNLAWLVAVFYFSIVLFILSMIAVPFISWIGEPLGAIAFALMILFAVVSYFKGPMLFNGDKVTAFEIIGQTKDRSPVLASLFVLFSLYIGLTMAGVLPGMYSDEFPQAYFELVNEAETGKEVPLDGNYRHEVFKKKYNLFLKNHEIRNK
ncbi:MAG TPA: hypothetical protein PKC30_03690 [Saprospiraceae bacterium]|nr:hypothetical protein [Saprospiraceae bacterium]